MTENPSIDPLHDYLLVKLDPLVERTVNGVILMEDSSANNIRTGTVLKAGPGKNTPSGTRLPVDVNEGEKIAFFRWHLEHKTGKTLASSLANLGDDLGLIKVPDVLFAFSDDLHIG